MFHSINCIYGYISKGALIINFVVEMCFLEETGCLHGSSFLSITNFNLKVVSSLMKYIWVVSGKYVRRYNWFIL